MFSQSKSPAQTPLLAAVDQCKNMTSHIADTHKGKKETHMAKRKNGKDDKLPTTTGDGGVVSKMAKTPDKQGRIVAGIDVYAGGPGSGRHAGMDLSNEGLSKQMKELSKKHANLSTTASRPDVKVLHNLASKNYGLASKHYKEGNTTKAEHYQKNAMSHGSYAKKIGKMGVL